MVVVAIFITTAIFSQYMYFVFVLSHKAFSTITIYMICFLFYDRFDIVSVPIHRLPIHAIFSEIVVYSSIIKLIMHNIVSKLFFYIYRLKMLISSVCMSLKILMHT